MHKKDENMCKINPRVDFAFKKLFGSEENKDLLISLINAIVSEQEQVVELELKNPYNLADYQAGKMSILDIKAKAENGNWFNVEMQIGEDRNFDIRAIYYWAKLVTDQLGAGMMYKELKKTISINILDYDLVPDTTEVHSYFKIINPATGKDHGLHDVFELHYIELKKFTKTYHEIQNALDRWSSFLTTAHQLDREHTPKELASDKNIVKAIAAIDRMFNEEERKVYEVRLKEFTDVASIIASGAEKNIAKGREEGVEIGMEQGVEIGLERGVVIGVEKGVEKASKAIALNLFANGIDISIIAAATGLSLSELANVLQNTDEQ